MIKISYKGTEDMQAVIAALPTAIQEGIKKSTKQAAVITKDEAIRECPVRTGYLRSTIFYSVGGPMEYSVGAKAPYGYYVEYGTSRMRAQPFLRPAFIFVTENIVSAMAESIQQEIDSL